VEHVPAARLEEQVQIEVEELRMIPETEYCHVTGKAKYSTKAAADKTIRRLKEKSRRQIIPKRVYHCRDCGGWHLTSQSKYEIE
jgi:hypothetical protein